MEEFSFLVEAAREAGLSPDAIPPVRRVSHPAGQSEVAPASHAVVAAASHASDSAAPTAVPPRQVSALLWGEGPPELVLFHGGAQNAHTWDTVAIALDCPILAVDLPGHGHSDWRADHIYTPESLAVDVQPIVMELAPNAAGVVGMSLGGITAIMLANLAPQLVRKLMLVDITPGVDRSKAEPILEFISKEQRFESFQHILDYTAQHNPTRSEASLRRGVLNNAKQLPDGTWGWRWDPERPQVAGAGGAADFAPTPPHSSALPQTSETFPPAAQTQSAQPCQPMAQPPELAFSQVWGALDTLSVPLALYKGADSGVVDDDDVAQLLGRCPDAEVVEVPGAGHSIQGDKPVELAALIKEFL